MCVQKAKEVPKGFSIAVEEGPHVAKIPDRVTVLTKHKVFRQIRNV
jgi:hypothetical protein